MWNPDQTYVAEQARRAELYAEAELRRAARNGHAEPSLIARIARLLGMIGAQLKGEAQAPTRAAERYPVATAVAATLLALDAGRAIMLSCEQAAHQRCRHVGRLIAEVLMSHGAPHKLVQWVQWGTAEETTLGLMASMGNVVLLGDDANRDQEQEDE